MYKNYIFDLYGTLVNIRTDEWSKNFYKKFAKWLRKEGYSFEWKKFQKSFQETEQKYRKEESSFTHPEIVIENVFREVFAKRGYVLNEEEVLYVSEHFRLISLVYLCLYEDTIECLAKLRKAGKKIYLLSNAQRSFTWQELERTGLVPYFDGILISSDEGCMKPDPKFYETLCERYELNVEDCIMIGNELKSDMAGAAAAGMDNFYINRYAICPKEASTCRFVSENGSLLEVLKQTKVDA